jgi:hypothetical protein
VEQAGPNPFLQGFENTGLWGVSGPERASFEYQQTPGQANQGAIQDYVNQAAEQYRNLPFTANSAQRNGDAAPQGCDCREECPCTGFDSEERYSKFWCAGDQSENYQSPLTSGQARRSEPDQKRRQ